MLFILSLTTPLEKTSKFTPKAWASLIKIVKKESDVLGDLLQELSDLYADNNVPKAHKKANLAVWLPLLKTLASFNSICPLIPCSQVCINVCFGNNNCICWGHFIVL